MHLEACLLVQMTFILLADMRCKLEALASLDAAGEEAASLR